MSEDTKHLGLRGSLRGHPVRKAILAQLGQRGGRELSELELSALLDKSIPDLTRAAMRYHLRQLREASLVLAKAMPPQHGRTEARWRLA